MRGKGSEKVTVQITMVDVTAGEADKFLREKYPDKVFGSGFASILSHFAAEKVAETVTGIRKQLDEAIAKHPPEKVKA